MKNWTKELWVGLLVLFVLGLALTFTSMMGGFAAFHKDLRYQVLYGFAGGVEVGSPVRVSGVKVGRVERIEFLSSAQDKEPNANLVISLTVAPRAQESVRKDSKFFINMAGIIGERYVEISPGTPEAPKLPPGSRVRGVDPPRIDQLLSQGYGVFGRIQDLLEENEEAMTDFLKGMNRLVSDTNKLLKSSDKKKIFSLLENLDDLTVDLKEITRGLKDPENKEIWELLKILVRRAHDIDKPALKKFLQEEGVRARIF